MSHDFGTIVLVPFPFTDQTGAKRRPAVVVSSSAYNSARRDIVLMPVTRQVSHPPLFGETIVADWRHAGLLFASSIKPVLATIQNNLVIRVLGSLSTSDGNAPKQSLANMIG